MTEDNVTTDRTLEFPTPDTITGGCPFEDVKDTALEVSRTLLLNLGERFLRGMKNQVTGAEHKAVLLTVRAIDRELDLRNGYPAMHIHNERKPEEEAENGER